MKKKVLSVIGTCCCLALIAAASVHAQLPGTELRANIPFDFSVRGKMFPAGEYVIKRFSDAPDGLMISGVNNRHYEMFETESVEARKAPNRGEIIFHRYGNSYFLSEIFAGGEQTGRELQVSRQERILKREIASNKAAQSETVAVAVY